MKVLLDRWQFGVTITYHFLFVPLTIGRLRAGAVGHVLELPPDGRVRLADAGLVRVGAMAVQARAAHGLRSRALDAVVPGGLHRHAVPGQHVRLAVHRDGTPAMDR